MHQRDTPVPHRARRSQPHPTTGPYPAQTRKIEKKFREGVDNPARREGRFRTQYVDQNLQSTPEYKSRIPRVCRR